MYLFQKDKLYICKKESEGFAIPQVLILGVGIAVGVSGLIAASILGLAGSKINRQELIAKASSYSGVTTLRTLLNDSSKDSFFHYFWPVNSCLDENECFKSYSPHPNPTKEYWPDEEWCEGSTDCEGRQKAPMCTPDEDIKWNNIIATYNKLLLDSNPIGSDLDNAKRDFKQSFNVISTKYIGTEENGVSSILIAGKAENKNSNAETASNKLRVNIQVDTQTPKGGFGFLSIGENQLDGEGYIEGEITPIYTSLFLGDLVLLPIENATGSIIWRRNLRSYDECGTFNAKAKYSGTTFPENSSSGIWVQPLKLPKPPRLSNVDPLGILICTPAVMQRDSNKCKIDAQNSKEKVYRIHSIYAKGPGSKFEVSTTDNNKITLEVMGDIDISNGGIFCHKNGTDECGTGRAENLTILFKQKTGIKGNKIVCNHLEDYRWSGGVTLKKSVDFANYKYPIDNNQLPGSSFLIDNTGPEKFGAFIYGPKVTFLSVRPKSRWLQIPNLEGGVDGAGLVVTTRASYGWIENTLGDLKDTMVNIVLTPNSNLIPYLGQKNLSITNDKEALSTEIVGVGYKVKPLRENSTLDPSARRVFLIYNRESENYHLRTFDILDANDVNNKNSEFSYPRGFAKINFESDTTDVKLGKNLNDSIASDWLGIFNINVFDREQDVNENYNNERNFSGAAWVKNLCFDDIEETKTWDIPDGFGKSLSDRYDNEEFNWGIRSYRGRSIILWDTLRDFKS